MNSANVKVGDIIQFGKYPDKVVSDEKLIKELQQLDNKSCKYVSFENKEYAHADGKFYEVLPLSWIVLKKGREQITLYSKDIVDSSIREEVQVDENNHGLRRVLNVFFFNNAFSKSEKQQIKYNEDECAYVYLPSEKDLKDLDLKDARFTDFSRRNYQFNGFWIKDIIKSGRESLGTLFELTQGTYVNEALYSFFSCCSKPEGLRVVINVKVDK